MDAVERSMIKAVIFDLDGTLLNRDASVHKFINDQYERFHHALGKVPKAAYSSRFIELDDRGYVWKDKVYQQLVEECQIIDLTWEELMLDYLHCFKNYCVPFLNLLEMIEKLKQKSIKLAMITNGRGTFQLDNIRALGIESYFETILISGWEGIKKPDPEIFARALKQLDVKAGEGMFVGDHPLNDVKAARDLGMWTVWKRDNQWEEAEADFIIDDLIEILLIVEQIRRTSF